MFIETRQGWLYYKDIHVLCLAKSMLKHNNPSMVHRPGMLSTPKQVPRGIPPGFVWRWNIDLPALILELDQIVLMHRWSSSSASFVVMVYLMSMAMGDLYRCAVHCAPWVHL